MENEERIIEETTKSEKAPKPKQWSLSQIALFLLFLIVLLIPYIHWSHKADNRVRRVEKMRKEVKSLRAEFITLKSEIVGQNKQTDIAEKLKETGLKTPSTAAYKIEKD